MTQCEECQYYAYDEDYEAYMCEMNMDEDEYADLGDYVSVYDERPAEEEAEPSGKSAIEKAPLKKKNKN